MVKKEETIRLVFDRRITLRGHSGLRKTKVHSGTETATLLQDTASEKTKTYTHIHTHKINPDIKAC